MQAAPKISAPVTTQAELKRLRALHQRRGRDEQGRYLVQGAKLVGELLASGTEVEALYATEEAARHLRHPALQILPAHELERIGTLESGNTLVAVVPAPEAAPLFSPSGNELVLVLDGISDPGNLGTLLRMADWFGVRRVITSSSSVDALNPKCVQATMGSIFRVQVARCDLVPLLTQWQQAGTALYLASMEGASVFDLALRRPASLVLGSESHGISAEVRQLHAQAIAIPRFGAGESLNVATAAAALCMEFARQGRG
jgi:TrmH family RNA methyltransferase